MVPLVVMDVTLRVNSDECTTFISWSSIDVGVRMINIPNNVVIGPNAAKVSFFFESGVFTVSDEILEFKRKKFQKGPLYNTIHNGRFL